MMVWVGQHHSHTFGNCLFHDDMQPIWNQHSRKGTYMVERSCHRCCCSSSVSTHVSQYYATSPIWSSPIGDKLHTAYAAGMVGKSCTAFFGFFLLGELLPELHSLSLRFPNLCIYLGPNV